jgi:hypothetical protein
MISFNKTDIEKLHTNFSCCESLEIVDSIFEIFNYDLKTINIGKVENVFFSGEPSEWFLLDKIMDSDHVEAYTHYDTGYHIVELNNNGSQSTLEIISDVKNLDNICKDIYLERYDGLFFKNKFKPHRNLYTDSIKKFYPNCFLNDEESVLFVMYDFCSLTESTSKSYYSSILSTSYDKNIKVIKICDVDCYIILESYSQNLKKYKACIYQGNISENALWAPPLVMYKKNNEYIIYDFRKPDCRYTLQTDKEIKELIAANCNYYALMNDDSLHLLLHDFYRTKIFMLILHKRKNNIVSILPRRLLIHLLSFL